MGQPENYIRLHRPEEMEEKTPAEYYMETCLANPFTDEGESYIDVAYKRIKNTLRTMADDYGYDVERMTRSDENELMAKVGLPDIDTQLEFIASIGEKLDAIDKTVEYSRSNPISEVIVPPEEGDFRIGAGGGVDGVVAEDDVAGKKDDRDKPIRRRNIPKARMELFLLGNDFVSDPNDPNQVRVITGLSSPNTVSRLSHDAIIAPGIERMILSCDQESSRTFVFDTAKLKELGFSEHDVFRKTKSELVELLILNPGLGAALMYSNWFTDDLRDALSDPLKFAKDPDKNKTRTNLIRGDMPAGVVSINSLARRFRLSPETLTELIEENFSVIGNLYALPAGGRGLSLEQQEIVESLVLKHKGAEVAPAGAISLAEYAKGYPGLSEKTVLGALTGSEELAEVGMYSFPGKGWNKPMFGILLDQKEVADKVMVKYLEAHPIEAKNAWKAGAEAKEAKDILPGEVSMPDFAVLLEVGKTTLSQYLAEHEDDIGDLSVRLVPRVDKRGRSTKRHNKVLSKEQQQIARRYFALEFPQEADVDIVPFSLIAKETGVATNNIAQKIRQYAVRDEETGQIGIGNEKIKRGEERIGVGEIPQYYFLDKKKTQVERGLEYSDYLKLLELVRRSLIRKDGE